MDNKCLDCYTNIRNFEQFSLCYSHIKNKILAIVAAYEKKKNSYQENEKDFEFKPSYFIDSFFKTFKGSFCDYKYWEERICKYYFFLQKELSEFFLIWAKFLGNELNELDFYHLLKFDEFKDFSNNERFIYLQLVWSYGNFYKHISHRAKTEMLNNLKDIYWLDKEISLTKISEEIIVMLDNVISQISD